MVKLSIITVNLNNCQGLAETIKSVVSQHYKDYEFLVIDGNSTDGSVEVIRANERNISHWISENDSGIYQAMNKGIRLATGEYLLFLNSGDWLAGNHVLENVFNNQSGSDFISGGIYYYDTDKAEIKWEVPAPEKLTAKTLLLGSLSHQATFIKADLFKKYGPYNEELRIVSDWVFFLDTLLAGDCSYQRYPGVVSFFAMDGISCNPKYELARKKEQQKILEERYPRFLQDYDRLAELESQIKSWEDSREFVVFTFLKSIGIIKIGVVLLRIFRRISRIAKVR
jgi:glycosyltransferase involved in cell wall biosynthesis